jgi:hypothetical protein
VAVAYASNVTNEAAEDDVLSIPFKLLEAAIKEFGPQTEIWHDYVSIPK